MISRDMAFHEASVLTHTPAASRIAPSIDTTLCAAGRAGEDLLRHRPGEIGPRVGPPFDGRQAAAFTRWESCNRMSISLYSRAEP